MSDMTPAEKAAETIVFDFENRYTHGGFPNPNMLKGNYALLIQQAIDEAVADKDREIVALMEALILEKLRDESWL